MARKKIITVAALAASVMLRCSGFILAGGAQGTGAYQFLQLGVGARPAALGEAFAGVSGDINALYWNPSGIAGLERTELSMTHTLWLQGITYSNIAYARPALGGVIGAAFNLLATGDIQKADNTGLRLDESYGMTDTLAVVSYARSWGGLALGANFKYISSRLEEEASRSYAADAGALYSCALPWGRRLGLGLSVQHAGGRARYVSEKSSLPVITRAGLSMELSRNLLAVSDLKYIESVVSAHAGAEYTRALGAIVLAARAGYKNDTVKELGALSGITAGAGAGWNGYQFDYAWNSFSDLGIAHRLSLSIKFGRSGVKKMPAAVVPGRTVKGARS